MSEIALLLADLENGLVDLASCLSSRPHLSCDEQWKLALADQKYRVPRGEACTLEHYCQMLPWLASDAERQRQLVASEFGLRLGADATEAILARFETQYAHFGTSFMALLHERLRQWHEQPLERAVLDRLCDDFEDEIGSGNFPHIELYLECAPIASRAELVGELVRIETYHLARLGASLDWKDYYRRFPDYAELIHAIQARQGNQNQSPAKSPATPQSEPKPIGPDSLTEDFDSSRNNGESSDERYRLARKLSQVVKGAVDYTQSFDAQRRVEGNLLRDHDDSPTTRFDSRSRDTSSINRNSSVADRERFAIRSPVAQGGLGIVFLAHDRQLNREVALKQVRDDRRRNPMLEQKFLFEAEITGQLEHPGVVPIYALGADTGGNPFYAMKFIRGTEMKEHIRQLHGQPDPSINFFGVDFFRLLKRFQDVCNTIAYVHTRGVIHRDLKPANVMLGSHGETLVVDWGLAKLLGNPRDQSTPEQSQLARDERPIRTRFYDSKSASQYGSFSGTVSYAAPEQLLGHTDRLGPATDIYSLGAILFEIITNEPPLVGPIRSIAEALERIKNGSDLDPRSRNRSVPLPLAMICCKALSMAPEDRYRTAFELSEDIDRWMADERVLAIGHREPWGERFGRLLRKYRRWTAPIALTVLFSAAVLVAGLFFVNRARLAERTAKESEAIAKTQELASKQEALQRNAIARDAIDELLVESTRALADFPATRDLQKRLLTVAAADYERLSQGNSQDEGLQLERVRALVRVADIEAMQGNTARSDELYAQSINTLETTLAKMPEHTEARRQWEVEFAKTIARRGLAWDTQDRIDESGVEYDRAQAIFDRILIDQPSDDSVRFLASRTRAQHASLVGKTRSPSDAISMLQSALAGLKQVSPETEPRVTQELAKTRESLTRFMGQLGRFDEAIAELESIVQELPASDGNPFGVRHIQERTASVHVSLANLHRQTGNLTLASRALGQSLETYTQLRRSWPDSLEYVENEALVQADMGLLWIDRRNPNRGQGELEQAKSTFEELSQNYPSVFRYATGWGTSVSGLGQIALVSEADAAIAADLLNQCGSLLRSLAVREPDPRTIELLAVVIGQLARARERAGQLDEAREVFSSSLDSFTQLVEQRPSEPRYEYGLAEVEWYWGSFERRASRSQEAISLAESASNRMKDLVRRYPNNRQYLARLAIFEVRRAQWSGTGSDETVATVQQSLARPIDEEFVTPEANGLQAWLAWQQGKPDEAREGLRKLHDQVQLQLPYDADLKDWIQELENQIEVSTR